MESNGCGCIACEKMGTVRVSPSVFCCNLLLVLCSNVVAVNYNERESKMYEQSEITVTPGGVMYSGKDATNLVRAIYVKNALSFYVKTGLKMTRAATPTYLLRAATEYTGHKYKRGQYVKAAEDLEVWINTMRAALPVTIED